LAPQRVSCQAFTTEADEAPPFAHMITGYFRSGLKPFGFHNLRQHGNPSSAGIVVSSANCTS
jgi:hypothetical protein